MDEEKELSWISGQLDIQQARGESLRMQMRDLEASVLEINSALDAINNIKKAKGDTLVPIGAGVYLSCPKPDTEKVILNIGASVLVQKKPDEAIKILEERKSKFVEAIDQLQNELGAVIREIESLSQRASVIAAAEGKRDVQSSKE
ncbi:MAG: prefoldin subunit alpha [Candidatus Micrarchaeota archaeon]|nr:prefoldin subunit alpha [Candidatus Micrarchaeota archaeon]